ncbi:hypothetical protein BDA96_10G193700 [Sorghum bicolor]|uniref:Uncharacterized protein n=2 Tax=Sorghum bicolor TaxID=4558 RepID=A0A921Q430_SORBI|nr:hypothetical protein BDA96_10G193700 [Sorghum bicolor]OQU76458.1 hypothetical protein SORBI_3010G148501 [Sorghum bicolor]
MEGSIRRGRNQICTPLHLHLCGGDVRLQFPCRYPAKDDTPSPALPRTPPQHYHCHLCVPACQPAPVPPTIRGTHLTTLEHLQPRPPRCRALGHRPTTPLPLGLSDRRRSSDQTRRVERLKIRAAGPQR